MEDLREKLEAALMAHDWYYMMSDDPRAYQRGQEAWERIKFLASKVDDGQELIAKYRQTP